MEMIGSRGVFLVVGASCLLTTALVVDKMVLINTAVFLRLRKGMKELAWTVVSKKYSSAHILSGFWNVCMRVCVYVYVCPL